MAKANKAQALKPVDSPNYSYRQALYMAFYSWWLYIDVGKRWKGYGFVYLMLVIALFSLPMSLQAMFDLKQSFERDLVAPLQALPPLVVQGGALQFNEPMPYLIRNEQGAVVVIIDTQSAELPSLKTYPRLQMVIHKNSISFYSPTPSVFAGLEPGSEALAPQTYQFSANMNTVFSAAEWVDTFGVRGVYYAMMALIYPLVISFLYALLGSLLLIFSLLGQLFAQVFFSFKPSFKQSCRLMMVAATPAIFAILTIMLYQLSGRWLGLLMAIILSLYYCYAILAVKHASQQVAKR